jgi:hypothetical protein
MDRNVTTPCASTARRRTSIKKSSASEKLLNSTDEISRFAV